MIRQPLRLNDDGSFHAIEFFLKEDKERVDKRKDHESPLFVIQIDPVGGSKTAVGLIPHGRRQSNFSFVICFLSLLIFFSLIYSFLYCKRLPLSISQARRIRRTEDGTRGIECDGNNLKKWFVKIDNNLTVGISSSSLDWKESWLLTEVEGRWRRRRQQRRQHLKLGRCSRPLRPKVQLHRQPLAIR